MANDKKCKKCIYWKGGHEDTLCCNYIFMERKRRPCPPGDECTVMIPRKRVRRTHEDRKC